MVTRDDDALQEVMGLFFTFGTLMQRTAMADWGNLELTIPQLKVLFILAFQGKIAIGKIAEILRIGHPTASHLVDRLELAGLARRVGNPTDRRNTLACLTAQGEELVRRLHQGHHDYMESCLAQLDAQDLAALRQGLMALIPVLQVSYSQETIEYRFPIH